jgi:hypothetical protein
MTSDAILSELRSLPGAPDGLRERVRDLRAPEPRFGWTLPRVDARRLLLVAAPAVVTFAVGAAAINGLVNGGTPEQPVAVQRGESAAKSTGGGSSGVVHAPAATSPPLSASTQQAYDLNARALPPAATRLNRYEVWLRLSVTQDELSNAAQRAMQIARGYGGYVQSVDLNTPGKRGTAALVLRVPVDRVEDAVMRLGKLGDVTAQHVRVKDLQRQADVQRRSIIKTRATIASLREKLAQPGLSTEERLRLEYRLDDAKRTLAQLTKARATTVREGSLASISATFHVPQAAAAAPHRQGRLERTARNAGDFLVRELAWLLYALIALAPIALLAAGIVAAVRVARRKSDERLLEST